jgi:hypothetical protein
MAAPRVTARRSSKRLAGNFTEPTSLRRKCVDGTTVSDAPHRRWRWGMKALIKTELGPGHLELRDDWPAPCARPGWVVAEVAACGICGTDLHIWHDQFKSWPPVVMGHEYVGRIVEMGPDVKGGRSATASCASSMRWRVATVIAAGAVQCTSAPRNARKALA